jgi:hypothetical protein
MTAGAGRCRAEGAIVGEDGHAGSDQAARRTFGERQIRSNLPRPDGGRGLDPGSTANGPDRGTPRHFLGEFGGFPWAHEK